MYHSYRINFIKLRLLTIIWWIWSWSGGYLYQNMKLIILSDIYVDVILGQDFMKQHQSIMPNLCWVWTSFSDLMHDNYGISTSPTTYGFKLPMTNWRLVLQEVLHSIDFLLLMFLYIVKYNLWNSFGLWIYVICKPRTEEKKKVQLSLHFDGSLL